MARCLAAIVLAGGYSSRMGTCKPLLDLGGSSLLERSVSLFREAGVRDVLVVLGHNSGELLPVAERLRARSVVNERYDDGMFSSVSAGVRGLNGEVESFFLLPVDIPLVRGETLAMLVRTHRAGDKGICYPVYRGRRGHPPLISGRYREEILAWGGAGGLRGILSRHEDDAVDVETRDAAVLLDMDTPEQYEQLRRFWSWETCPSPRECEELMLVRYGVKEEVFHHCRKVADLAVFLVEKLNGSGCRFDGGFIEAAALLHDLAKGMPDHGARGAEILEASGLRDIARLVAVHMSIRVDEDMISPAEILYLADKLVRGNRCVTFGDRFVRRMKLHASDPDVRQAVVSRLEQAEMIRKKVEDRLKASLYVLLRDSGFL